jgi:hypothetical protein
MLITSNHSKFYPDYQCAVADRGNVTVTDPSESLLTSKVDSTIKAKYTDGKSVNVCISAEAKELMCPALQSKEQEDFSGQTDLIMKARALKNTNSLDNRFSQQQHDYNYLNVLKKSDDNCKNLKIDLEKILTAYQSNTVENPDLAPEKIYGKALKYHGDCQFFESMTMTADKLKAIDSQVNYHMWSSVGAGVLNGAMAAFRQGYPIMGEVMLFTSTVAGLGGLAGYTLGCHFETTKSTSVAFQDQEIAQSFIKKVLANTPQPLFSCS